MIYRITHLTAYSYSNDVTLCQNEVRLTPRDLPNQYCRVRELRVSPEPVTRYERDDYYGNKAGYFSVQQSHKRMEVEAISVVEVLPPVIPILYLSPAWEHAVKTLNAEDNAANRAAREFVFDSLLVPTPAVAREYALPSFTPGRPLLDAVMNLTTRIFKEFKYDPNATTISTPLPEVFRNKRGVCQDFAHVQLACLRSMGIAARYVSGYLQTFAAPGKTKLIGADASHAWISAYCPELGWVDFDPTNNLIPREHHIVVAYGRDYDDVPPIRGVILGGGENSMTVSVDVSPV